MSADALLQEASACPTSQRDLRRFAATLEGRDVASALSHALTERRADAFAHLLLAALAAGIEVDAGVLVEGAALMDDPGDLAAAAGHLRGDVAAALLAAVRGHGIGWDREPTVLLLIECWCRRNEVERPPGLVAEARIRCRRELTQDGEDALVALQALVDDPDLATLIEGLQTPEVKESARILAAHLVERLVSDVLSGLPERPMRAARTQGPVRRSVAKVGRNSACPCGSGKKYKHCCEARDKERLADSSDVEGLTGSELELDLEAHLTEERLLGLRGHQLARLDPTAVPEALHPLLADHLALWGEIEAAVTLLERCWRPALDEVARIVAEQAAKLGRPEAVARVVALRETGAEGLVLEARLALCTDPAQVVWTIEEDARAELDVGGVDLGLGLMAAGLTALGIHVARSELLLRPRDAHTDALQFALLEARDELLAPPWDPVDDVLFTLNRGVSPELARELATSKVEIDRNEAALGATREALDRLKRELAVREASVPSAPEAAAPTPTVPDPEEAAEVRDLRERLSRLKDDLKDRHRERNALRKDLERTRERMADLEAANDAEPEALVDDDEDEEEIDGTAAARVRVPVLPDDFGETLRRVPDATARAAMIRLGELCAGTEHAFRECRPLRGFEGTWRAKVGRSYRLLFQPGDDTLEVIDLVHRQQLEKRLARIRRD